LPNDNADDFNVEIAHQDNAELENANTQGELRQGVFLWF
jgi:hypothetical protein